MPLIQTRFCSKKTTVLQLKVGYSISIHEKIGEIEQIWSGLAPLDVFFSSEFHKCIEVAPPSGIKPLYVILYKKGIPDGILYFQYKYVKLAESIRFDLSKEQLLINRILNSAKKFIAGLINMPVLICGNSMLTGTYGFHLPEITDAEERLDLISQISNSVNDFLQSSGYKKGLILIKDLNPGLYKEESNLKNYTRFKVQPDMVVNLPAHWKTMDDYFEDMKSKYRVRARRAFKKCSLIEKRLFSAEEIRLYRNEINGLYKNVSDEAGFNMFVLHEKYFETLKEKLGDKIECTGYFLNGELVGFFTAIHNYHRLDAHFLGYSARHNPDCQIYHNMLYDLIKSGIVKRVEKVVMSRTALEIKSSVGADPEDLVLYLSHSSDIVNTVVAPVLKLLTPVHHWKERNPFRGHKD